MKASIGLQYVLCSRSIQITSLLLAQLNQIPKVGRGLLYLGPSLSGTSTGRGMVEGFTLLSLSAILEDFVNH